MNSSANIRNQAARERELASKVSQLKQIGIDIGTHVSESNLLLDDMGQNMGNMTGMLQNAQRRVKLLMNNSGMRIYCYLTLFVIFVFVMLLWIIKML